MDGAFDRALPVSATRASHLVIGQAGVVIVAVRVPAAHLSEPTTGRCATPGLPDADDVGRVSDMIAAELGRLRIPVWRLWVPADGNAAAKRWDATGGSCPLDRVEAHLRSLPRSLPEQATKLVAAVVNDLCPPIVPRTLRQPA